MLVDEFDETARGGTSPLLGRIASEHLKPKASSKQLRTQCFVLRRLGFKFCDCQFEPFVTEYWSPSGMTCQYHTIGSMSTFESSSSADDSCHRASSFSIARITRMSRPNLAT